MARSPDSDHSRETGRDRDAPPDERRVVPPVRRALKRERLPGHVPPRLAATLSLARAATGRVGRVVGPPARIALTPLRIALRPIRRYIEETEAPADPAAPAQQPVTLLLARSNTRLLHVEIAATQPAKMRVVGVNGTLRVDEGGIAWAPGRASRMLGALDLSLPWAEVQGVSWAHAERGIPTRVLTVETANGGFELSMSDRAEPRVAQALRHFGGHA